MRRQIDSAELNYLYTKIGEAIWHLQHVENVIASFILMKGIAKELNSLSKNDALKHEKRLNKLPLGTLISEAENLNIFEQIVVERIKIFNKERKWVVHNSIFESGSDLYTDSGRNKIFARIEAFVSEAMSLHRHIGELAVEYSVSKGMDKQQIYDTANNYIKVLKGDV